MAVTVRFLGRADTKSYLSYSNPTIFPSTLFLASNPPVVGNVTAPTVTGGQEVRFSGKYFGINVTVIKVNYAPRGLSSPSYNCTSVSFVGGNTSVISCFLSRGVGLDLTFRLTTVVMISGVPVTQVSQESLDSVTYPSPTITNNTLASGFGIESNTLVGTDSQGQVIYFRGTKLW